MKAAHEFQTVAPRAFTSMLRFAEASVAAARGIRACIFDVDGVLTDGTLYISEAGETLKAFHALDGHGLKLLAQGGITPIVITGRDSPAVRRRLKDLGLVHAVFGAHDKLAAAEPLLAQLGLSWPEVAAMGDDWPDLPLLLRAGLAVAPLNAHPEVRGVAHHTTSVAGGHGAARECCDLLLQANGRYEALMHGHLTTLDTTVPSQPAGQVAGPQA
jgi:3-deoxy-D-manno-octulosonate 8-phosphate phosphatase (KDO 8-P phosphatase)